MSRNTIITMVMVLALAACGYDGEEEKEAKRKEDLQELSQEMNNTLTTISTLKIQLRDSIADLSEEQDSLSQVKVDRYRILLTDLEKNEEAYKNWQQEIDFAPETMTHEEAMEYYQQEEEKAEVLRQDMRKTVEYVENEIMQ